MKKTISLFILFFATLSLSAQQFDIPPEPTPELLSKKKSLEYKQIDLKFKRISIPGTHLSIVPPVHVEKPVFLGRIVQEGLFEMSFMEFEFDGVEQKMREIDSTKYADRGGQVYREIPFKSENLEGKIIYTYADEFTDAVQFVFWKGNRGGFISTLVSSGQPSLISGIISSYKTAKMEPDSEYNAENAISYTVDKSNRFRYRKTQGGMLMYLEDGVNEDTLSRHSIIFIAQFPTEGATQDQILAKALSNDGIDFNQFEGDKNILINGANGKTIIAKGRNSKFNKDVSFRFTVLTKDDITLMITASYQTETDLAEIDRLIDSIKFKF